MRDSVLVDAAGTLVPFPWQGPDTAGKNWRASLASPQWREHLLQQAQWIMEILQPDAITVDETFAGLGYDHHPDHAGPTSAAAIDFYRKLHTLVRSFGNDKAVFTSDCSMSGFVLWADGARTSDGSVDIDPRPKRWVRNSTDSGPSSLTAYLRFSGCNLSFSHSENWSFLQVQHAQVTCLLLQPRHSASYTSNAQ